MEEAYVGEGGLLIQRMKTSVQEKAWGGTFKLSQKKGGRGGPGRVL